MAIVLSMAEGKKGIYSSINKLTVKINWKTELLKSCSPACIISESFIAVTKYIMIHI